MSLYIASDAKYALNFQPKSLSIIDVIKGKKRTKVSINVMHMSWWECTWWAFHSCCPITIAYVDVPKCSERTHPPCTKARDTSRWVTMIKVSAVVSNVTRLFTFALVRAWTWNNKVWMTDCNGVFLIIHIQRILRWINIRWTIET